MNEQHAVLDVVAREREHIGGALAGKAYNEQGVDLLLGVQFTCGRVLTTHAGGTSNSHQRVRPQDFLDLKLVQSPVPVREAFTRLVKPVLDRIATTRNQTSTLAVLRDALLPKLVSGELRVKDAEQVTEDLA